MEIVRPTGKFPWKLNFGRRCFKNDSPSILVFPIQYQAICVWPRDHTFGHYQISYNASSHSSNWVVASIIFPQLPFKNSSVMGWSLNSFIALSKTISPLKST